MDFFIAKHQAEPSEFLLTLTQALLELSTKGSLAPEHDLMCTLNHLRCVIVGMVNSQWLLH